MKKAGKLGKKCLSLLLVFCILVSGSAARAGAAAPRQGMAALERENAQPGTVLAEGTRTEGEMVGAVPEGEAGLALTAPSAVLLEGSTGTVLFEKEKDEERMIASVTKVMTMLLIFEALDSGKIALSDPVTVSAHAASMGGSQVYLEENEVQTVETMIKCICIASANDAATAMAEHIAGSEEAFVEKMNQRAGELGMEHTHFLNCCGLDDDIASGHYSSAYDVALMSRELIMNHPQIKDYSTVWMDSFVHSTRRGEKEFGLTNTNRLVRTYEGITGLKTGSTSKAKYCLSATAQRNGVDMIAVVLGAATPSDRFGEASSLLNYGFANTQVYRDLAEEHGFETVEIKKGVKDTVSLGMEKDFSHVFTKGEDITAVSSQAIFAGDIQAPVKKGDVLGSVEYFYEGEKLGAAALLAQEDIGKAGFLFCFGKILKRYAGIGEEKAEGEA